MPSAFVRRTEISGKPLLLVGAVDSLMDRGSRKFSSHSGSGDLGICHRLLDFAHVKGNGGPAKLTSLFTAEGDELNLDSAVVLLADEV